MKEQEVVDIFKKTGALLAGHFKLSSGLHSSQYLQCALVLQHPAYAAALGAAIAEKFKSDGITVVAGPAIGGIVIAHEAARALYTRCVFGERQDGTMTLRRGFSIDSRDRVLLIEDVITTGGSIKELAEAIKRTGATIAGIGTIVDRGASTTGMPYKVRSLIKFNIRTFSPSECPLCQEGIPVTKPGSRK